VIVAQGSPSDVVWAQSVHDEDGRWQRARLRVRVDGALALDVGNSSSVLDDEDARSLFATLGRVLAG
jgi:hypothetical protein